METALTLQTTDITTTGIAADRLAAALPMWHTDLQRRVEAQEISQDTAAGYKRGVTKFLTWLKDRAIDSDILQSWKIDILKQYTAATFNAWFAGVKDLLRWAADKAQINYDPSAKMKGAKRKGTNKRHKRGNLTNDEARRLMSVIDRTTKAGKRDYAMIVFMLYTAARTIEVHRANLADLTNQGDKLVLLVEGKGHTEKDDVLVLVGPAEEAMLEWLAERGTIPGALFTSLSNQSQGEGLERSSIREIIKGYLVKAGITRPGISTHSLRHTAITNLIKRNVPMPKVMGMSRHASLDTLMIYYHETDRIEDPAEQYISY